MSSAVELPGAERRSARAAVTSVRAVLLLAAVTLACGGSPKEAVWRLTLDGETSTPALGRDGALLVVTTAPSLVSVSPEGTVRWSVPLREGVLYAEPTIDGPIGPIVLGDGDIVAAESATSVVRYSAAGELRWRVELPERMTTGFTALADGAVVAACRESTLVYIASQGTIRSVYRDRTNSSEWTVAPVVLGDGSLAGVLGSTHVVGVTPQGTQAFSYAVPGLTRALALGPDQSLVYVTLIGTSRFGGARGVVALGPDGAVRWSTPLPQGGVTEAVVGADGVVHAVSWGVPQPSRLVRTSAAGQEQDVELSANALAGPLLGENGSRIVRTRDGLLTVIDRAGKTVETAALPAWRTAPVLDKGGALFATAGRELLRFQVSVDALATGSWARPRGDNRSSGSLP